MSEPTLSELAQYNIHVFLKLYGIKTESGKPLDFTDHAFLLQPLEDDSQRIVIKKSAQCGMSTMQILKVLWLAKFRGYSIAYILPTFSFAAEFTRTKINPIIQANPIFRQFVSDNDTLGDKRIGNANLFIRGSFSDNQAISFTADALVVDEVDRSDQQVIASYASRLQHSKVKKELYFSNPSVPGRGVSHYWNLSDQKHWFIRCGSCRKDQYLAWPESVDMERGIYQCKSCHAELTDVMRRRGRWVARFKDREWSGYHINLLMCPWVPAKEIIGYYKTKPADYFFNMVLGQEYVGNGNVITPDIIYRNLTEKVNTQERVVIGCDSGLVKHYVLGNKDGIFHYGKTESWDDIRGFLKTYQQSIAVLDALPDLTEPRKMVEEFPGRVFLCHFSSDRKGMELIRWGKDKDMGTVTVDRHRALQMMFDEFADMRIPVQGTKSDWEPFYDHFKVMYRLDDPDGLGNQRFTWESSNSTDHWVFGCLYWRVGMDRMAGMTGGSIVGVPSPNFKQAPTIDPSGRIPAPDPHKVFSYGDKKPDEWRF